MQALERNRVSALNSIVDDRGQLVVIEGGRHVPFGIERVYTIIGKEGVPRGFHAHHKLQEWLVCLSGSCRVVVDNGFERGEWVLDRADQGLWIGPMEWRELHDFSEGAVVMCLASAHYDEADYIREYDHFLALAHGRAAS